MCSIDNYAKCHHDSASDAESQFSVGPAPSPVSPRADFARQLPHDFKRHLPHFEGAGGALYVTFATKNRWELPEAVRGIVLEHALHDHGAKMEMVCAVVMPDHVHLLYYPMNDSDGNRFTKTEVVGAVKSVSAHSINRMLGRKGPVWQDESFDRVLRRDESVEEKAVYIVENPVRKGICATPQEYPFVWRAWIEGQ